MPEQPKKVTLYTLNRLKAEGKKAVYITAYDYPSHRWPTEQVWT